MNNENKFIKFLKDCISSHNSIINSFFDVNIVGEDEKTMDIKINVTDNKEELQILYLQLNFTLDIMESEEFNKLILTVMRTEETSDMFKQLLLQTTATLFKVCEEKLKLSNETEGETN